MILSIQVDVSLKESPVVLLADRIKTCLFNTFSSKYCRLQMLYRFINCYTALLYRSLSGEH